MFSCEFCEISKSTFSYRTSPVAASVLYKKNWKLSESKTMGEIIEILPSKHQPSWINTIQGNLKSLKISGSKYTNADMKIFQHFVYKHTETMEYLKN